METRQSPKQTKRMHGCVTAWLILIILLNSIIALIYFFGNIDFYQNVFPQMTKSLLYFLGFLGILNVVAAVLLLMWKKIGFWLFLLTTIGAFVINVMIKLPIFQSLAGYWE